jgi:hypothetical protein
VQLGPYSERYGCSDPFYEMKILHTGEVQACSRGMLTGLNVNGRELDELWNHPWYLELRKRLYAKRFTGLCDGCAFRFGSMENQALPLRTGVHHSHEHRLRASDARGGWEARALRSLLARLRSRRTSPG